ncbi:MAG: carboxypeptidase regulatory-like domain-containing protein [Planctomycetes bacterium]|nr:carboxypeptidase regulatory-like domain-containing protein [Planctomycetota bacterium]
MTRSDRRPLLLGAGLVLALVALLLAVAPWSRTTPPRPLPPATAPATAAGDPAGAAAGRAAAATPIAPAVPTREAVPASTPATDEPGPGELFVYVQRGSEPLASARVRVWRVGAVRLQDQGHDGRPPEREAMTGADGRAAFADLAGGDVAVRADHGDQWRITTAYVAGSGSNVQPRAVYLHFGTGSIRGRHVGDDGAPVAGWGVYLAGIGPDGSGCRTTTATDGSYAFEAVGPGRYHVQLEQRGPWATGRERMLTLDDGEHARCDFGPTGPRGTLQGRIVDGHGTVVPGARFVHLVHAEHDDEHRLRTAEDGTFAAQLPPGRWLAFADAPRPGQQPVASVQLAAFAQCDVPWPGIRLLGHVVVPNGVEPPSDDELRRSTMLAGPDGVTTPDLVFAHDGHRWLQWLGLEPGSYVLRVQGQLQFADAPRDGIQVSLSPTARCTTIELVLAPW